MSYTLQALIAKREPLEAHAHDFPGLKVAPLTQGLGMIPLTEKLFAAIGGSEILNFEDVTVRLEFERLSRVGESAKNISRDGCVAYVEADYFGGEGAQAAAAWQNNQLELSPSMSESPGPINRALQFLGAKREQHQDEFASVGLQRHRSIEAWLEKASKE